MAAIFEKTTIPAREDLLDLEEMAKRLAASGVPRLFDTHPLLTLVLSPSRRIVYANRQALFLARGADPASLRGQSFGEAMGCVHAHEGRGGCGGSEACAFCGVDRAIRTAEARLERPISGGGPNPAAADPRREEGLEDCNIVLSPETALPGPGETSIDLRVWTEALELDGGGFIVFAAQDISAEKRREILERIFYHDIANTASGIRTLLELLDMVDEDPHGRYRQLLKSAAEQLVEEIESQRALKAAESKDLAVRMEILEGRAALEACLAIFAYKLEGKDIALEMAPDTQRVAIMSDATLLRRVLANMVKNAIEAAVRGEVLLVGIHTEASQAVFWVKNSAVMPEVVRRRIFHRSFSTKGPGRGIGTYSMRLLAENYLGGSVRFSSREGEGTVFELRLPLA
jgi:signal transduction histidine kinase